MFTEKRQWKLHQFTRRGRRRLNQLREISGLGKNSVATQTGLKSAQESPFKFEANRNESEYQTEEISQPARRGNFRQKLHCHIHRTKEISQMMLNVIEFRLITQVKQFFCRHVVRAKEGVVV